MYLQVKQIVLWPRNARHQKRTVPFELGMVNVISGASKTGKSSVIPIIDYCLGAERCAIPVRTIRKACSWFGIVVETVEGEKLLARREPGDQAGTGDMFIAEGATVFVPEEPPEKNTTVDAVKRMLDRLAGLSNLSFDPAAVSNGFKARPAFRDLVAFSFQPQNVVANPDVLLYRADTVEHREKLRTIFPYVLGAVTPALLVKQWEFEILSKELRRKERELGAQQTASESWRAGILNWITEASELGLITEGERGFREYSEEKLIALLQAIVARSSRDAMNAAFSIAGASEEYSALLQQESDASARVSIARRRLDQINSLRGGVAGYASGLNAQRSRLGLSRWLRASANTENEESKCPICRGPLDSARHELDQLCDALTTVELADKQVVPAPAMLDRELVEVRSQLRTASDSLNAVRIRRRSYEDRSKAANEARLGAASIERFLGRAEQALDMFVRRSVDTQLADELGALRRSVAELRAEIARAAVQKQLEESLESVSRGIGDVVRRLDAEQPDERVGLDIKDLTVKVGGESGRADYLWELGSGANWLSYHVSTTVALQQHFLGQPGSPVPHFLVYDQPSQVYFPRRLAHQDSDEDIADTKIRDEDIAAIRRFFEAFGQAVIKSEGRLQIIVLDHAGSDVWGELEGVTLVEEWRGDEKLVPMTWLD